MSSAISPGRTVAVSAVCLFLVGFGGSILLLVLPAIAADFHAQVGGLSRLGATLSLGAAVALPLSVLADRWRRGAVAAMAIAGFSLAALISALAPGLGALAAARFAAVCFETLVAAVATAAAVEAVGAAHRGRATSLLALGSGVGAALTVVAYPLLAPHWRWLYGAAAATGLLLSPVALLIPGRRAGANPDVGVLLRPPWRRRLLVLAASGAFGGFLFEPANFFSVLFGSTRLRLSPSALSLVLAASGIAAAVGFLAGGLLSDRYGRRGPGVALLAASAVLAAVSFGSAPLYVGAGIAWSLVAGAATPIVGAWTGELVPSRARVTAYTAVGMAGALGGLIGLQVAGAMAPSIGLAAAIWVTAAPGLAGAGLLALLPETRGAPLPD